MSRLARITSALLCLPVLLSAFATHASQWVPIGSGGLVIFIPIAQLDRVEAQTFYYGTDATLTLEGFDNTASIYYQTQQFSNGAFGAFSDWACQSKATLAANNNALKLPLLSGRYRVNVAAVMMNETCDSQTLADFKTDKLVSSAEYVGGVMTTTEQYKSNEFMVIDESTLNVTDDQMFIRQDDSTNEYTYINPIIQLDSYNLHLKWSELAGTDAYQLSLYKDDARYESFNTFDNPIDAVTYQSALLNDGYFTIEDEFYSASPIENGTFTGYTGPGEYTFAVNYCFNGQCSKSINYAHTITVAPLVADNLYVDTLPSDPVVIDWIADKRSQQFILIEEKCKYSDDLANEATSCDITVDSNYETTYRMYMPNDNTTGGAGIGQPVAYTGDNGKSIQYRQTLNRTLNGVYRYNLYSCKSLCDFSDEAGENKQVTYKTFTNNTPPTTSFGQIDQYKLSTPGNVHVTGYAYNQNDEGVKTPATVLLQINGIANIMTYTTATRPDGNYGFDFDLSTFALQYPSARLNIELKAIPLNMNSYYAVDTYSINKVYKEIPIANDDNILQEKGKRSYTLNVTNNDNNDESNLLLTPIVTGLAPVHGSVTTVNKRLIYTPFGGSTAEVDTFYYKAEDRLGQRSNLQARVTLKFAHLVALEDAVVVDWHDDISGVTAGNLQATDTHAAMSSALNTPTDSSQANASSYAVTIDVMGNDVVDAGDGPANLKMKLLSAPQNGVVPTDENGYIISSNGSVTYTLTAPGPFIADEFSYYLERTDGEISTGARVGIDNNYVLQAKNDPQAGEVFAVPDDGLKVLNVVENDFRKGIEDQDLRIIIQSQPSAGRATPGFDGALPYISYDPQGAENEHNVSFTYSLTKAGEPNVRSNIATVVLSEVNAVPLTVTALTVVQVNDQFTLNWQAPQSLSDSYELQKLYSETPVDPDYTTISWNAVSHAATTSHTLTNQTDGYYFFRVRACRDSGARCGVWTRSYQYTVGDVADDSGTPYEAWEIADVDSDIVGSIAGKAGVSGGAANYSVPIQLPPGRAGVQPGVSLNYSSNGRNGLLGYGWSLSAAGSVSRCGAIYAIDGKTDAVQYNANDKLCLNGQRLILSPASGSYGATDSVYHPEMNPTTKVTLKGDWAAIDSSFTVELSNGGIQYYGNYDGNAPDSVNTPQGITTPNSWRLASVRDLHDNSIHYTYEGQILKTIHYTGRGEAKGDRVVNFEYDTRDDWTSGYRAGGYTVNDKRLKAIVTTVSGEVAGQYNLRYLTDGGRKSLLHTMEQCFGAYNGDSNTDHCLPVTTFTVKSHVTDVFAAALTPTKTFDADGINYNSSFGVNADYNGDGKNDLLVKPKYFGDAKLYLTAPEGAPASDPITLTNLHNSKNSDVENYAKVINQSMDFNLDGRLDVVGLSNVNQQNGVVVFKYFDGTNMQEVITNVPFKCTTGEDAIKHRDCSVYIIDINKDGKMDLLTSNQPDASGNIADSRWLVYLNTHSGEPAMAAQASFELQTSVEFVVEGIKNAMSVMDIDGDGYDNLVSNQQGYINRNDTGSIMRAFEFSTTANTFTELTDYRIVMRPNATGGKFVDFNQDGLADFIYAEFDDRIGGTTLRNDKKWRLRINTGTGFSTADDSSYPGQQEPDRLSLPIGHTVCRSPTSGLDEDHDKTAFMQTLDYNRDGITDILMPGTLQHASTRGVTDNDCDLGGNNYLHHDYDLYHWQLWLGKRSGDRVIFEQTGAELPLLAPLTDFNLMDYDGDGYVDVVTRLGHDDMGGSHTKGMYAYLNGNATTDLVTHITDGMDLVTQFDYGILSDPADANGKLYSTDFANSEFPNVNFNTTDTVVKAIHTTNGFESDGTNTTNIYYSAARFNKQGRGFQGFGQITQVNERREISTQTTVNQTFPYTGMVTKQLTYLKNEAAPDNNYLSKSENTGFVQTSTGIPYAQSSASQSRETDGSVVTTTVSQKTLNAFGHPSITSSTVCDGGSLTYNPATERFEANCGTSPWQKTTTTETLYKTIGLIEKPKTVTTTATVSYGDNLGREHAELVVTKGIVYNTDWTVQSVTTTDDTVVVGQYAKAPSLIQSFKYYGEQGVPSNNNALGQLYEVAFSSSATDDNQKIENERSAQTQYTADGYFVASTHNSQWGTGVSVSAQTINPKTGQVDTATDVNGNTLTNKYDGFNRLYRVITPGVPDVVSGIQICGGKADGCSPISIHKEAYRAVTQQAGAPAVYQYLDKVGRVLRETTIGFKDAIIESSTTYNQLNQVLVQTSPGGTVTFPSYDELGRPESKTVDAAPNNFTVGFNYQGLTTTMNITANGTGSNRDITRTVNSAGNLMTSEDEAGHSTLYRYNPAGMPTVIQGPATLANPSGVQTTATYNALGHKNYLLEPNQGEMQFSYNALGELRSQFNVTGTDASGNDIPGTITRFNYDKLGRTTSQISDNGETASYWEYDGNGVKGTLTREYLGTATATGDFVKTYGYDSLARMNSVTTTITGRSYTQGFEFDPNYGRLTAVHHPDNTVIHYGYDAAGFPVTESYATQSLRTIEGVDHNGLLTKVGYGNGLTTETTRLRSGAISDICTAIGTQGCGAASEAQHIVYDQYDSFGNLGRRDNRSQAVMDIFNYDTQDRLITAGKKSFGSAEVLTHYRYDESGNMSAKSDFSLVDAGSYSYGVNDNTQRLNAENKAGPNAVTSIKLKHNALNQNESGRTMDYDYDAKGNIIRNTVKKTGLPDAITRELTYNANNKPVTITDNGQTTTFSYGSDGMRYRQVVEGNRTVYYIGGGSFEVEVDMATAAEITRSYIGDYAMRVIGGDNSGLKYLHRDRLGSIDTITNGSLTATVNNLHTDIIEDQRTFDAFGKARNDDGGTGISQFLSITPRGFTNHEHLAESGLIHMNGRAYDPDLGRFLSVDPIISDPSDGQSFNAYSYVENRPLQFTDPSGYNSDEANNGGRAGYKDNGKGHPFGWTLGEHLALRSYLLEQCEWVSHKGDSQDCVGGAMALTLGYSYADQGFGLVGSLPPSTGSGTTTITGIKGWPVLGFLKYFARSISGNNFYGNSSSIPALHPSPDDSADIDAYLAQAGLEQYAIMIMPLSSASRTVGITKIGLASISTIRVVNPTYNSLKGLNKGFQSHHILPQYLGKMLGYTTKEMLEHPATLVTQWTHTGKLNLEAIHKAISYHLPPMEGRIKIHYSAAQIRVGLESAYNDLGRPELFNVISHLIK